MTLDITVTDMFCGAGGSTTGATLAGATVRLAMNHWKRAIETHSTNYPTVTHALTDLQTANPRRFPSTTILLASPECFPAGILIVTSRGIVSIEDIRIGDEVLTHRNRWRPVTQILSHTASTIIVRGQGHPGLEVTAEHPFYVREQTRVWDNAKRDYNRRVYSEPGWVASSRLLEKTHRWATPVAIAPLPIPSLSGRGMPFDDPEFWWLIGRWLGDGTVRSRTQQHGGGEITIVAGNHEADALEHRLAYWSPKDNKNRAGDGELRWRRRHVRTAVLFECGHQSLVFWLLEHFGKLASGKTIPVWVFSLPRAFRQALLDGYISADGHSGKRGTAASTISKRLGLGIRLLAESLGYRTHFHCYPQHTDIIEGRKIQTHDQWVIRWENNASQRAAFADDTHAWGLIKKIEPGHEQVKVYTLSVEEDESYVADGIVVHNCTAHTLAKGRKRREQGQQELPWEGGEPDLEAEAEERSRCTMWTPLDWAECHNYQAVILENVVDAHLWRPFQAWLHAWKSLGYDFELVYLNSMYAHPTPQSRDRMYFVAWKRGNRAPDLSIRPLAFCVACGKDMPSVQSWKNPQRRYGKYKQQYVYRCPSCAEVVTPYYYAAATAIDWSIPTPRIGDRVRPLREKTMQRIAYGLEKFARDPFTVQFNKTTDRVRSLAQDAFPTQTGDNGLAMVLPFLLTLNHPNTRAVEVGEQPFPTQTAYDDTAVVMPSPLVMHLSHHGSHAGRIVPVGEAPFPTQTAREDLACVVPPFLLDHLGEYRPRAITGPCSTICAAGNHHSLVVPPAWLMTYYRHGQMVATSEAVPTVTTLERHALVTGAQQIGATVPVTVEACGFRMLVPKEIQAAMAFPADYVVTGTRREQVKQLGNAVSPPVMHLLMERVIASL